MSQTQNPTLGQKLIIFLLIIFFSFSFIHKPKPPQDNPVVEAKQVSIKDLSSELPYYQSELYQGNQNIVSNSSSNPILEQKFKSKNDLKVENLTFNDELGVFVNDQNKLDLIQKTKLYIAKYSKSKPILDAEMVVNFAQKTQFPLDLMLIQAQTESNFCTNGRAVISKQCWNIGAYDAGDTKKTDCNDGNTICQDSYLEGLELYHRFMTDCHFHAGEKASLQRFLDRDFRQVRTGSKICGGVGKRYATDPNYRKNIITILQKNFNPIFK